MPDTPTGAVGALLARHRAAVSATCAAVHFTEPTIPFAMGVPVRCTKPDRHPPNERGDVWHAASGRDLDGEVFGSSWRYMLALPQGGPRDLTEAREALCLDEHGRPPRG